MRLVTDSRTGERWVRLDREEEKFGFLSQCVEALAEAEQWDYVEMLDRLERADLTEGYILRHYEVLHTESFEHIVEELRELLHKREAQQK